MSFTHFTFSEAESSLSTSSSAYTLHLSKCILGCTGFDHNILRVFFGPFAARLVLELARRANLKKIDEIYWQRRNSGGFYTFIPGSNSIGPLFFVWILLQLFQLTQNKSSSALDTAIILLVQLAHSENF
jgi:hypothetical protein